VEAVNDEVDGRSQRLGDRQLPVEPVVGAGPEFRPVGQLLMIDDDEEIEIGLVALGGVRLVDPAAAGVASVENDLEDWAPPCGTTDSSTAYGWSAPAIATSFCTSPLYQRAAMKLLISANFLKSLSFSAPW
jgi:hypothetical protein